MRVEITRLRRPTEHRRIGPYERTHARERLVNTVAWDRRAWHGADPDGLGISRRPWE